MLEQTKTILWRILAVISLILGVIGAFLPIMPTVPFVLVAAWAGGQGWPELERYLLNHPRYGQHIRQWRENGAVSRKAKCFAVFMMSCSSIMLWFSPAPLWSKWAVSLTMAAVAIWLVLRPEPVSSNQV
ncbi:YbaN family protein [Methylobacillus glycogenes]|uniref:YbaN family protein n=1 Tax=Methylobacillus glycogenes TaxID=406 RepID=UPI00055E52AD|nr:YbaN family protein [Methylobacillus glycogenes]MBL8506445.1 YbaN family protein [Methylobacillus glycogenes]